MYSYETESKMNNIEMTKYGMHAHKQDLFYTLVNIKENVENVLLIRKDAQSRPEVREYNMDAEN